MSFKIQLRMSTAIDVYETSDFGDRNSKNQLFKNKLKKILKK